ncbi:MAG TPA: efflux RND transporter periplasmic adaptor subunit [Anaerolineales bacterium]|nr:efflux RND transporter periplasmic adaptor subunit [Anaerolineales bacterium]
MAVKTALVNLLSTAKSRIKEIPALIRDPKKRWWVILPTLAIVLAIAGGTYYGLAHASSTSKQSTLQTATARIGDITLSASGTGTLQPADQIELGFGTSGKLTKLNVKVGDTVKEGDLLAELDNTSQQIQYQQAKRSLAELVSTAAIAQAQEDLANAMSDVDTTKNTLVYLISPDVFYWEQKVADQQKAVDQLKVEAGSKPTSDEQKKIDDAVARLKYFQDSLAGSKLRYEKTYVPNNFTVIERDPTTHQSKKVVEEPTEASIASAEAAYTVAQASVQEAQWYLDALNGKEVPDNATGANLTALETAQLDLKSAEAELSATQIYAPLSGTVMSVDAQLGDTVSSSVIMVVADLSKLYLKTYVDESDYSMFKVGNEASIVFDALPDQTFTGKVIEVDPQLDTSSGSAVVSGLVQLDPTDADLLMGMGASVEIVAGQTQNAVIIPVDALHEYAPGKYSVFIVQNGKLTVRNVEVGLKDLVNAEIKSGLEAGEVVSTGITETKQ